MRCWFTTLHLRLTCRGTGQSRSVFTKWHLPCWDYHMKDKMVAITFSVVSKCVRSYSLMFNWRMCLNVTFMKNASLSAFVINATFRRFNPSCLLSVAQQNKWALCSHFSTPPVLCCIFQAWGICHQKMTATSESQDITELQHFLAFYDVISICLKHLFASTLFVFFRLDYIFVSQK